jgi:hypothetical protein
MDRPINEEAKYLAKNVKHGPSQHSRSSDVGSSGAANLHRQHPNSWLQAQKLRMGSLAD